MQIKQILRKSAAVMPTDISFSSQLAVQIIEMTRTFINHRIKGFINLSKLSNISSGFTQFKLNLDITQLHARTTAIQNRRNNRFFCNNSRIQLNITNSLPTIFAIIRIDDLNNKWFLIESCELQRISNLKLYLFVTQCCMVTKAEINSCTKYIDTSSRKLTNGMFVPNQRFG